MGIVSFLLVIGLAAQGFSYPSEARVSRQTSSGAIAGAGAAASTSGESDNNGFGIGAAAGIGGLGSSAGIGSFNADTRSNAFQPFGAFAGMNLGSGGRIGAGCSGLSCGVQLGNFALATPQLLGMGRNFFNNQRERRNGYNGDQYAHASSYNDGRSPSYNDGYYGNYDNPFYNNRQYFPSSGNGNGNGIYDPYNLLQGPLQFIQQFQQNQGHLQPGHQNVADYARFGGGTGPYFGGGGGASSSTFGSSSNGGKPVFSSTSTHVDSDGKVTTVESGSELPDRITTGRIGSNGGGVYAASGTSVDPDGKVTNFKDSGSF